MSDTDDDLYNLMLEEEDEEHLGLSEEDAPEPAQRRSKTDKSVSGKILCHYPLCQNKSYKSVEGYRKHLRRHVVGDLLENAPGRHAVLAECRSKHPDVLEAIKNLKVVGGISEDLHSLATHLQAAPTDMAQIFIDCVAEKLLETIPTTAGMDLDDVHPTFVWGTHKVLSDLDQRIVILNLFKEVFDVSNVSDETVQWFLTEYIRQLSTAFELLYIRSLKDPFSHLLGGSEEDRDDAESVNFQKSVHYIGGSAVKSVLRKAQLGLGSDHWSDIYDCIYSKFLVKEGLPSPGKEIEAWTNSMDRGGLKHVNIKVWEFLMALSGILKKEEGKDGSILHENVYKSVTDDMVMMFMWNEVTENSLKEEVDLLLLRYFCEFFTNAWLKGVALRRKNAIPRLSRDKAALRSKLSS